MFNIIEDKTKDKVYISDEDGNQSIYSPSFNNIPPLFIEFLKYLKKINIKSEDYFKKSLEKISQCKKEEYNNCYNLFLEALKDIDNDNNENDKSISDLYKKYEQITNKFDSKNIYKKIICFFLDYVLFNLIKNSNEEDSSKEIAEDNSLEEIIVIYEEKKKNISDYLKSFFYNFYSTVIVNNSNKYQIINYNCLVCKVNEIKKPKKNVLSLDEFFNYYYKKNYQFYCTPKYMHILFINNDDNNSKIRYNKDITVKCYNNNNKKEMEVNYTLYFEIKDNEYDDYSENENESDNSDLTNEKNFIESDGIYKESHKIIMLIYKMNDGIDKK